MAENREREKDTTIAKETSLVDHVVSVKRVTKVTKGGKRFSFSALVISGDQKGKVGIALGRGREVSLAIDKARAKARKNMFTVQLRGNTIPYDVLGKHGASSVIIRSASKGTGVIAGGAVRAIMDAIGVKDVLAKSLGASNARNVAKAALNALAKLRSAAHLAKLRNKTIQELVGENNNGSAQ